MIKHTFLDKANTIIKDSNLNTGLNPVVELNTGRVTSRILLHFNLDELLEGLKSGEYQIENLTHRLKMFNCGSINLPMFNDEVADNNFTKVRASSFDIIAFRLPYIWDKGRGFDYHADYFQQSFKKASKSGSTWFNCQTYTKWDEEGVYSHETLANDESLIIGVQHFDTGVEDINMDITDYVNSILTGEYPNYGIGLMFSPIFEKREGYEALSYIPQDADETNTIELNYLPYDKDEVYQYIYFEGLYYKWNKIGDDNSFISFFSPETNTFFNPYLETRNSDVVVDNRYNFHIGVNNRLYFFATDNGEYFNLDETPTCSIDGVTYPVKQSGKGIYYVELCIKKDAVEPNTILYDTWSNIVLNGEEMDDIEMEFVVLPMDKKITLGKHNISTTNIVPSTYGINDNEQINIGEVREIKVDFIEEFSNGKKQYPNKVEYRLYVKEGNREIDVYSWQPIELFGDQHIILIDTNNLIPNDYFIDINIYQGRSVKTYEKITKFTIVSNVTKYQK